jgi:hypothetical protein
MSTIRANTILDAAGGNTATINGITPALSSQAQAEAGTDNATLMSPLRVKQATGALTNIDVRTTTGSFTVPAGVTRLYALAFAGGGGGASGNSAGPFIGGGGGYGGQALSVLTVTPGASISYTVGLGGAGNNGAGGSAGTSTTVDTITCTGGGGGNSATGSSNGNRGTDGTGTGGNLMNDGALQGFLTLLAFGPPVLDEVFALWNQSIIRPQGVSLTTAIAYSLPGSFLPGARGSGETSGSSNDASGGVGGAVIFFW